MASHRLARPLVGNTVFLICDIQAKFRPLIWEYATVVQAAKTLTRSAQALGCPVIATEQYPKALGHTVEELQPFLKSDANPSGAPVFAKTKFSMMTEEVDEHLRSRAGFLTAAGSPPAAALTWQHATPPELTARQGGLQHAVLYGIEAHVCVQQTALELLSRGVQVHCVVDGVSSQRRGDRAIALTNMAAAGVAMTTVEAILFQLMGGAGTPQFKKVQPLVIEHAAAFKEGAGSAPLGRLDFMA